MQRFYGFDDSALIYNRQYSISDVAPVWHQLAGAFISPNGSGPSGSNLEEITGGAFTTTGHLAPGSLQPRSDGHNGILKDQFFKILPQVSKHLDRAVYGGPIYDHFGHFLLETTSRLWAFPHHTDRIWIFSSDRPTLRPYQLDFLKLLGLSGDQIVVANEWIEVSDLVVPDPAFHYHHFANRMYREIFRRAPVRERTDLPSRIFLSRSERTMAKTIGELELEELLRKDAWDIVTPERLPAHEQAELFRNENVILGLQGSAMHLGLFGRPGRSVIHLCRGQGYRGYYILDDLVEANASYLSATKSISPEPKLITGPFLLDLDCTINFLQDQGLLCKPSHYFLESAQTSNERLETEYLAWWHYTESQIRFHCRLRDNSIPTTQESALEPALMALSIAPKVPAIISHALSMTLQFCGLNSAIALLDKHFPDMSSALESRTPELLGCISMICSSAGRLDEAVMVARAAHELAPSELWFASQLASVLFHQNQLNEAEAVLSPLLASGSASAENFYLMSMIAQRRDDDASATTWGMLAVEADSKSEPIVIHVALLLEGEGRHQDARAIYLRHLDQVPPTRLVLQKLAKLEIQLGLLSEGSMRLEAIYKDFLDDGDLRAILFEVLVKLGRLPDLSLAQSPFTPAEMEQAILVYEQSRFLNEVKRQEQAVRLAIRAVQIMPSNRTIVQHLFSLLIQSGCLVESHILVKTLLERGNCWGGAYYALSLIEMQLGRLDAAKVAASDAFEIEPDNVVILDHHERLVAA